MARRQAVRPEPSSTTSSTKGRVYANRGLRIGLAPGRELAGPLVPMLSAIRGSNRHNGLSGAAHTVRTDDNNADAIRNGRRLTPVDGPRPGQRIAMIQHFESRLQGGILAVEAAVTEPWSNGPVEGQVNRLKTTKRQMCNLAGVELLRARLMPLNGKESEPRE